MSYILQLPKKFEEVIKDTDYSNESLTSFGIDSSRALEEIILRKLNASLEGRNIVTISYVDLPVGYLKSVKYGGSLVDKESNLIAYVFTTSIDKDSRSAYISQQIGGTMADIILTSHTDMSCIITNFPIYILDIDCTAFTNQKYFFVECAFECGCSLINVFGHDYRKHSGNLGLNDQNMTIVSHDNIIKNLSHDGLNNYYELNETQKTVELIPTRLKPDRMTNEVYYYSLRALAAMILAKKDGYRIQYDTFEEYFITDNKNIEALLKLAKKINSIDLNNENTEVVVTKEEIVRDSKPFSINRRRRDFVKVLMEEGMEYKDYQMNPGSIREASLRHEKLINETVLFLEANMPLPFYESKVDLFYIDEESKEIHLYEMKTIHDKNWKKQIRSALGQLLEYEHFYFLDQYSEFEIKKNIVVDSVIDSVEWDGWLSFLATLSVNVLVVELD